MRGVAFLINAHQNANQKPEVHTGHSVHFHPNQFTRPSFSIFRGSGSETTRTQAPPHTEQWGRNLGIRLGPRVIKST